MTEKEVQINILKEGRACHAQTRRAYQVHLPLSFYPQVENATCAGHTLTKARLKAYFTPLHSDTTLGFRPPLWSFPGGMLALFSSLTTFST